MANVKDLLVNGTATVAGKLYASGFIGNLTGGVTDDTMTLYAHHSNEVNFGGSNDSGTIYFGYRSMDSKPIPSTFVFGGTGSGSATVKAGAVYGSVWNDLSDSIPVDDDCELEHGYCYCFDGKRYTKASRYLDDGIIGIHSDTYGFKMGAEEGKKKMDVAVSGFVLAHVDKEYKPGTPLTCTKNGYLTKIKFKDKLRYPEKIVATYWKSELADEWGSGDRKVKVNGRKWVKIK